MPTRAQNIAHLKATGRYNAWVASRSKPSPSPRPSPSPKPTPTPTPKPSAQYLANIKHLAKLKAQGKITKAGTNALNKYESKHGKVTAPKASPKPSPKPSGFNLPTVNSKYTPKSVKKTKVGVGVTAPGVKPKTLAQATKAINKYQPAPSSKKPTPTPAPLITAKNKTKPSYEQNIAHLQKLKAQGKLTPAGAAALKAYNSKPKSKEAIKPVVDGKNKTKPVYPKSETEGIKPGGELPSEKKLGIRTIGPGENKRIDYTAAESSMKAWYKSNYNAYIKAAKERLSFKPKDWGRKSGSLPDQYAKNKKGILKKLRQPISKYKDAAKNQLGSGGFGMFNKKTNSFELPSYKKRTSNKYRSSLTKISESLGARDSDLSSVLNRLREGAGRERTGGYKKTKQKGLKELGVNKL